MKRAGRLRPVSRRRRRQLSERGRVVEAVRCRDGGCRAASLVGTPCGGSFDVHEIIPRSAWPAGWLVESNCVLVCRRHHDWIGDHPSEAAVLGLHGFSWQVPA